MTVLSLDIIAGALVAFAALPKIFRRIKEQRKEAAKPIDHGDLQRDGLIISGNVLWVVFGLQQEVYGLVIFGSINVIFTSFLIAQAVINHTPRPMV